MLVESWILNGVLCASAFALCCALYRFVYYLLYYHLLTNNTQSQIAQVTNYVVSGVHGLGAAVLGCVIVMTTQHNLITARHSSTAWYPWVALGYGIYDMGCMYRVYCIKCATVARTQTVWGRWQSVCRGRPLMIVHHLWLLVFALPVIVYFRNGKGDFFMGCFMLFEITSPFLMCRAALAELGLKQNVWYKCNGLCMIVTHLVFRVLIFWFMWQTYASYKHIHITQVVWRVPHVCVFGCGCLFSLQLYWWIMMVKGAYRIYMKQDYSMDKPTFQQDTNKLD